MLIRFIVLSNDHYMILNNDIAACTPLTTLEILSVGRKMMDKLPEEMVEEILDKLSIEEKMVFRLVSRKFYRLTTNLILKRKLNMIQAYATTGSFSDSMRYFQDMVYTNPFHQNPKHANIHILDDSRQMRSLGIPYATSVKILLGTTDEFQSVLREHKEKMSCLRRQYKNRQAAAKSRGLNPHDSTLSIRGLLGTVEYNRMQLQRDFDEFYSLIQEHKENVSGLRRKYKNRQAAKKSRGLNQHESIKSLYLSINLF